MGRYKWRYKSIGFRIRFRVVISRVRSRVTILTTHIRGLVTPLLTTHEPPSTQQVG